MTSYCTLQEARTQLATETTGAPATQNDPILFDFIEQASAAIDEFTGYWFEPRYQLIGFNGDVGFQNPELLLDGYPLVRADTFTNGDGTTVLASNYTLLPIGRWPKTALRMNIGQFFTAPSTIATGFCFTLPDEAYAQDALQITGYWVYHKNYPHALVNTGLTLNANIDADDTQLALSAAPGVIFDVGSVLYIDDEYMRVVGPLASSLPSGFTATTITVMRDYNNYTDTSRAIAHTSGKAIYLWQPETTINSCCAQVVAAFYKQRDNATGDQQIVANYGGASVIISVDIPARVKGRLQPFRSHWRGRN